MLGLRGGYGGGNVLGSDRHGDDGGVDEDGFDEVVDWKFMREKREIDSWRGRPATRDGDEILRFDPRPN